MGVWFFKIKMFCLKIFIPIPNQTRLSLTITGWPVLFFMPSIYWAVLICFPCLIFSWRWPFSGLFFGWPISALVFICRPYYLCRRFYFSVSGWKLDRKFLV